jgi:hypothetical protein
MYAAIILLVFALIIDIPLFSISVFPSHDLRLFASGELPSMVVPSFDCAGKATQIWDSF